MKVVHCRKEPYDVYIGRPGPGNDWGFGNPFIMGEDGDRNKVIHKFEVWLKTGESYGNIDATDTRRQWILDNIHTLKGKTIACWCSPLDCHGDVLIGMCNG